MSLLCIIDKYQNLMNWPMRKRNKIQGYARHSITCSQHKIIELHINQMLLKSLIFSSLQNMSVTPSIMHVHVHRIIYVDIVFLKVDRVLTRILKIGVKLLFAGKNWSFTILFDWHF